MTSADLLERGMRRAADLDAAACGLLSGDALLDWMVARAETLIPPSVRPAEVQRYAQLGAEQGRVVAQMLAQKGFVDRVGIQNSDPATRKLAKLLGF